MRPEAGDVVGREGDSVEEEEEAGGVEGNEEDGREVVLRNLSETFLGECERVRMKSGESIYHHL